jgi:UDP-N-acetylglucosamine 2-epimerase (non-hydrolysing)
MKMSSIFFDELEMPRPDIYLEVGSGSHAAQTARVMERFETVCVDHAPDLVMVAGDVNSTLACALTASKMNIPVAHLESGLRSFDRQMPEEINRILTDHVSDLLFVTEPSGQENLQKEGISREKIHFVGNTMIDTLQYQLEKALERKPWQKYDLSPQSYVLVTLHRPANVDNREVLAEILSALETIGRGRPVLFPIHPRTWKKIKEAEIEIREIQLLEPLGYLTFLGLMAKAQCVLTDSGGIQEETTALCVPCVTIRENTERPITLEEGTNSLAGTQKEKILAMFQTAITTQYAGRMPKLWDGNAAVRVGQILEVWFSQKNNIQR